MKKFLMAAAAAGAVLASSTGAYAEAVKLQLKWVTQAQFAELIGTSQQRLSKLESAGADLIPVQWRTMDRITRRLNGRPAEARTSTGR